MKTWTREEIDELRGKYNLSQPAFSKLLGVSGNYIYLLEKGVKKPSTTLRLLLDCVEKQLSENEKGKERTAMGEMGIREKIFETFQSHVGEEFTRQELIQMVRTRFPETNEFSILPSDYCYNLYNKGIQFKHHILEHVGRARYKVLGLNHKYNGVILWRGKPVGYWVSGEPHFNKALVITKSERR